jgi:hypothetical protein
MKNMKRMDEILKGLEFDKINKILFKENIRYENPTREM